ncbi:hypothetical protein EXIGLDRAFT_718975, partial [Exidia glandulosa HHB12029]
MGKPLPPELLLCIFEFARRMRAVGALASAARASHTFNALVTPLLYRTLVITSQNYTAFRRAKSQITFHDRAQLVHDLVIEPDFQSDVSKFGRPAEELEDILALFPNATTYAIGRLTFWPLISYELMALHYTRQNRVALITHPTPRAPPVHSCYRDADQVVPKRPCHGCYISPLKSPNYFAALRASRPLRVGELFFFCFGTVHG